MPASRVVLWRHGRTASNAARLWQGQTDVPLDDLGIVQAAAAAATLVHLPPAAIVTSDLSRAAATAETLGFGSGVTVQTDKDLREVDAGAWEGLSRAEIEVSWADDLARWRAGEDLRIGGGERISEAGARCAAAIQRHAAATDGALVVVGHGGAIRSAVQQLLGVGTDGRFLGTLRNAHWAVLLPTHSGWALDAWNVAAPEQPTDRRPHADA